jgi:hypothetical protein
MKKNLIIAILLFSFSATGFTQNTPSPFAPPVQTVPSIVGSSIQEMEALADRLMQRSQFQAPAVQSYWSVNPTLGFFSNDGSTAYILWINGTKLDLRQCGDVNTLKSMVASNSHRRITGAELPGGYRSLYPENIEEIARNASCGVGGKLKNLFGR